MTLEQIAQIVGQDPFARFLGVELLKVGEGYSKVAVTVDERMLNSHNTAHGGVIFSLADAAFAIACNSHGQLAVALNVTINYVAPAAPGTRLIAEATEESLGRRIGLYRLVVTAEDGTLVATCQATAYRKNQPVVE
ncbi:MAG: hydroxyphenylacetyl-CoA thioesterase PaaI [Anaerolineae bacterium]|nr:MAG: hydroxyphenylacetyl-CoA thioesterase PaaI [Anaerolineae bacterium]